MEPDEIEMVSGKRRRAELRQLVRQATDADTKRAALPAVSSTDLLGRCANMAKDALLTDGAHHKQWYLAMILKELDAAALHELEARGDDLGVAP